MALPVETNPYIIQHLDFREQEKTINLASHLLEVEGVYHWNKPPLEELFDRVRIFCSQHRINFGIREFNSAAFVQDREYITRLPAFHIYYKDEYEKSFYGDDDPAIMILEVLREIRGGKPKKRWFSFSFPVFKWKRKIMVVSSTTQDN
jgi:hypothetical protein